MNSLVKGKCIPCEAGTPPLQGDEIQNLLAQVQGWEVKQDKEIGKKWKFENFIQAFDFVKKIAELAESEGHHPDITLGWGKASVKPTTHAIGGLASNYFIMAAKIDAIN